MYLKQIILGNQNLKVCLRFIFPESEYECTHNAVLFTLFLNIVHLQTIGTVWVTTVEPRYKEVGYNKTLL